MENKTPQRNKAIRTRQKLLETTFEQIAANGYHNITVDKIAAAAGVSTGSAYRYFKNKKEMLLATIAYYYGNIQEFSQTQDSHLTEFSTLEEMLTYVLDQFYAIHKKYYAIHEELESLRHIDPDIKAAYDQILQQSMEELIRKLPAQYATLPNLKERLYLGISILENYAHTQMEDSSARQYDMDALKSLSIQVVKGLLSDI